MSDIDVCAAMTSSSPLPVMRLPPWTSGAARDRPESSYPAPRRARRADPARARFERRAKMRPHTEGASAMAYRVTFIPGDGVGPELSEATRRVLEGTGVEFEWDVQEAGADVMDKYGTPLPEPVLESIRKNKVAIKGPITTPIGTGFRSVNGALRQALDLYALVRPVKAYKGAHNLRDDLDFIIVRENTEDIYAGIEFEQGTDDAQHLIDEISSLAKKKIRPDSGLSIKPISISGSERIVEFAFDYARRNNRRKVTAVHKANIMKHTDGLFLAVSRRVAERNPDIEFADRN